MSEVSEQSVDEQNSGAVEADQPELELEQGQGEGEQQNAEQDQEEDEEVEVAGRKLAMPKSVAEALKAERMMQADYTRKTQEVAEQRKAFEAQQEQFKHQVEERERFSADFAKVVAIDDQLAELRKIDLSQYTDSDPVGVQRVMLQIQQLEAKRSTAVNDVAQKQQQYAMEKQQTIAKQIQEAETYFAREIPGWSAERSMQLQQYAKAQGVNEQKLAHAILGDPAIVKAFDKAEKWDRLAEKQAIAKPKPQVQAAPVTRVRASGASANNDPDKMSTEDWLKWRNQQLAKR